MRLRRVIQLACLFLVTLLLAAVLTKVGGEWQPASGGRESLMNLVKVITIFTVAHSISLALCGAASAASKAICLLYWGIYTLFPEPSIR